MEDGDSTYTMMCTKPLCEVTFTWEGHVAPESPTWHADARNAAYAAAKANGWTITQDHDGNVRLTCPGLGEPAHLLSSESPR